MAISLTSGKWWRENIYFVPLGLWSTTKYWLSSKYSWAETVLMYIFIMSLMLCFFYKAPEVEMASMNRRGILCALAFATLFVGTAIWYNRSSWLLAALVPTFIAFFISFVTFLIRKPQQLNS
jgi:hypothetical protein